MKKLLLLGLMFPMLAHAAKWIPVGAQGDSKSFIDKSSMVKTDAGYKAWSLVSHAKAQATQDGVAYLSMKALHVYSCAERSTTLLSQVFYGEAMGRGPVAQNLKFEKFSPEDIVPDSVQDGALAAICKGRKK